MAGAPGPDLLLRDLAAADLPEATDLWVETWSDTFPQIDFESRRGWFVDRIVAALDAGVAVTAAFDRANGAMAGFVTVDRRTGHLDQLAVSRAHRGTGAARILIAHAKAIAPGRLHLEVNTANARAIGFYEREGFRRTGEGISAASGLPLCHYAWTV